MLWALPVQKLMESLKEKTARGLFWGGMNTLVMQLIGVAFGILLARLLDTSDYGMMAAVSVFTMIATELKDSGFKTALTNLKHPEDRDYNAVFWFNLIAGLVLYAILFVSAPLIGRYYANEAIVPLARYAFLSVVITAFSTSQGAWLFKQLKTKELAKASMTATLVSSTVGAGMAFGGCGYWSLATQGLVFVLVNTLLVWHYSPWRPHFELDFEPAWRMFRFSFKIMLTAIATQLNNNVINILAVKYYKVGPAGHYSQAYQWDFKAYSLVQGMVNQVAQPVLVSLDDDGQRQLNALRKMMRFTAFIAFPLLFGLALVSREFIVLAIGTKWLPSVGLLRLLCLSGAVMPLCSLLSNLIISKGRSGTYMWATLVLCAAQIALLVMVRKQGIHAMVLAYTALNIAWLMVWFALTSRLTGYRFLHFITDTLPFALAASGVMMLTFLLTKPIGSLWLLLLSRIAIAGLLYYVVMRIAGAKILRECMTFILRRP